MFVALAIVGCASEDFSGTQQVASPTAGADVNGTWNVTWGPLTGRNTYTDTTVGTGGVVTVTTNVVNDTCAATGTLTLTQASDVAHVSGPWALTGTCIQRDSATNARSVLPIQASLTSGSIANANLGSGVFTFSLEALNRRFQYGLVQGSDLPGSAQWSIAMPARPTKARGSVRGDFTATKQ